MEQEKWTTAQEVKDEKEKWTRLKKWATADEKEKWVQKKCSYIVEEQKVFGYREPGFIAWVGLCILIATSKISVRPITEIQSIKTPFITLYWG